MQIRYLRSTIFHISVKPLAYVLFVLLIGFVGFDPMTTRGEWAIQVLRALGNNNPDAQTVNLLAAWTACEFDSRVSKAARYNPLATKRNQPGATNFNSVGVRDYPDPATGLRATIETLKNGHYPTIVEGLRTNKPDLALNHKELGVWGTGGGCVERVWKNNDVRDQPLPSYDPNIPGGSGEKAPLIDYTRVQDNPPAGNYTATNTEETSDIQTAVMDAIDPSQLIARAIMGGIGSLFLLIAIILTVRTYVPVKQVMSIATKIPIQ